VTGSPEKAIWLAGVADARDTGLLLHEFNSEFDVPTPGPERLAERVRSLLQERQTTVLLAGAGPDAVAVLRFRPAIWSQGLECSVAELYVRPALRGRGMGRALMQAAIAHARAMGADRMEVGTGEQDVVARALYESLGFSNRDGKDDGPVNYFYEREL
jgi:GNAT superfamily N-acetyltransferase